MKQYLLLALCLLCVQVFSDVYAANLERECNNTGLDTSESICGRIVLDKKYTQCDFNFDTSVDFTDFDIVFYHRYGRERAKIATITEYTDAADYSTLTGYLWKASANIHTAAAATAVHSLILIRLNNTEAIEFFASSTNASVEGWLSCSDK